MYIKNFYTKRFKPKKSPKRLIQELPVEMKQYIMDYIPYRKLSSVKRREYKDYIYERAEVEKMKPIQYVNEIIQKLEEENHEQTEWSYSLINENDFNGIRLSVPFVPNNDSIVKNDFRNRLLYGSTQITLPMMANYIKDTNLVFCVAYDLVKHYLYIYILCETDYTNQQIMNLVVQYYKEKYKKTKHKGKDQQVFETLSDKDFI